MGILIKGMEMPTGHGVKCICIFPDGKVANIYDSDKKQIATAVPVPLHGDLIDRDGAVRDLRMDYAYAAAKIVALQPTIIPAEKATQREERRDEAPAGPYDMLYEEGGENLR